MDYSNFKTEDFLADESFQDFVLHPEKEQNKFWDGFLKKHPEKKVEFRKAVQLIQNLILIHQQVKKSEMEQDFAEMKQFISKPKKRWKNRIKQKIRSAKRKLWKKI
ncbi:hypothetical protein [Flexithrix dorotheae]|uniref:hypothetical protein n=1 Tax=Flexithrix dorotheae TaxID=70993 RepID=UPI000399A247|nr:hypothetical protein [Flexithrix dorotheae]